MRSEVDVSVIIPTLNSEKYISRVLHAIYENGTYLPRQP